ncbi:hypothetical protein HMPREF3216_00092 [Gardnerella vaginalis]|uniref:Uncharacterized protein n=1 Tax=Gardnerella vaginalis TaxID=2702 RepID=A0A133NT12_GARVA|nr:hypothetical protein HMPREF3216_00092 [Gardnerella vaginalis]
MRLFPFSCIRSLFLAFVYHLTQNVNIFGQKGTKSGINKFNLMSF